MLHRLEIENFYSVRDPQVIDLRIATHAANDEGHLAPIHTGARERAPKVVAVFGANASGKSNVLRALSFIAWFVRDSFSAPRGTRLPFYRFNDPEMLEAPTRLVLHLDGLEDIATAHDPRARRCAYVYEVVLGGGSRAPSVLSESLCYKPSHAARRMKLFTRDAWGTVTASQAFGLKGFRQALDKVLRPDASVIATLAQLDHPYGKSIWGAASGVTTNILVERTQDTEEVVGRYYADRPKLVEMFNREVERIDLGIAAMKFEQGVNGPRAMFTHHGLAFPMPLAQESHGTRQFIRLYPLLLNALETGGIAIVDELDSAIHPLILPEILRWFRDPVRNPRNAQLWMTCHNASLLDDLSKEEVLFCEKDGQGRTSVYGLRDIKPLRRGENYNRKYLGGAFGAVPHIG